MGPIRSPFVRSVLLPANLIAAALVVFGVLVSTVEGDLRRVPKTVDPELRRPPAVIDMDSRRRGNLTVWVTRARSSAGKIQVWLYRKGPFTDGSNVVAQRTVPASPRGSVAVFEDLPWGVYAVQAFHDENENQKLDLRPDGTAAEGLGASSFTAPLWGPSSFEEARFVLELEAMEIEVQLFY
jgi:uncharacterized protein (DUF2141 family)